MLRVPRIPSDFETVASDLILANRHIWRLTSYPFPQVPTTSETIVTAWAQQVGSFASTSPTAHILSFIDSLRCDPGDSCEVQVYSQIADGPNGQRLDWRATAINTRIVFGGPGTADATFIPEIMNANLRRPDSTSPFGRQIAFEHDAPAAPAGAPPAGAPPAGAPPAPPPPKLSLKLSGAAVDAEGNANLHALVNPAMPILSAARSRCGHAVDRRLPGLGLHRHRLGGVGVHSGSKPPSIQSY